MRPIKFKMYLQHEETGNRTSLVFDYAEIFSGVAKEILERDYKRYYVIGKGQYTGLKDKNGKEIYEGDILKYANPRGPSKVLRVIEWKSFAGGTGFNITDKSFARDGIGGTRQKKESHYEVIGNIYENPELLQK